MFVSCILYLYDRDLGIGVSFELWISGLSLDSARDGELVEPFRISGLEIRVSRSGGFRVFFEFTRKSGTDQLPVFDAP